MKHLSTKRTCMYVCMYYVGIENLKGGRSFIVAWVFNFTVARFKMGSWKFSRTDRVFFLLPMSSREFWDVLCMLWNRLYNRKLWPAHAQQTKACTFARYLKRDQNNSLQKKVLPPKVGYIMLMNRPTTMKYEILNILFGRSGQPPAPPLMPYITR